MSSTVAVAIRESPAVPSASSPGIAGRLVVLALACGTFFSPQAVPAHGPATAETVQAVSGTAGDSHGLPGLATSAAPVTEAPTETGTDASGTSGPVESAHPAFNETESGQAARAAAVELARLAYAAGLHRVRTGQISFHSDTPPPARA